MGCVSSRPIPSEERAVMIAEEGLFFHIHYASRIDSVVRKFSCNGKLNDSQLQRVADTLRIKTSNHGNHTKISLMFEKLQNDGEYDMKDLLIVGILLGKGTPSQKANLIYQVFDESLSNNIPIKKLKEQVFKKLCHHSVFTLGNLVSTGQSPISNELKTNKYISELSEVETLCINKLSEEIAQLQKDIDEEVFTSYMSKCMDGALVSATGWRTYLHQIYVSNPPRKKWPNPYSSIGN